MDFILDKQLSEDTIWVASLSLCEVLLMDESRYPWCILGPRRANISEIFQLNLADQKQLWHEITTLANAMAQEFHADKMNIANLGNIVSQLHIHCIVRYHSDACWPAPVWGKFTPEKYSQMQAQVLIKQLKENVLAKMT